MGGDAGARQTGPEAVRALNVSQRMGAAELQTVLTA
jgi:hypothetical protein